MKINPCPYQTCVNYKDNDCDSHQLEVCVKLRAESLNKDCGAKMKG